MARTRSSSYTAYAHRVALVSIKVFHRTHDARRLVRTLRLETTSSKPLTASRAARLLKSVLPEYRFPIVTPTAEGWFAHRALRPEGACDYHFVWEEVVLAAEVDTEVQD